MRRSGTVAAIAILLALTTCVIAKDAGEYGIRSSHPFVDRREGLLRALGEGIAVLYSQGRETETGYRADGSFWYLTGLDEPGAIVILAPRQKVRQILLLPPRDIEEERGIGRRQPLSESLRRALGFDAIYRTGVLDPEPATHGFSVRLRSL